MKIQLFLAILITTACTANSSSKNTTKNLVEEGYVPKQKIDFSHVVHSDPNGASNCSSCHKEPNTKVELNVCATCHSVPLNSLQSLEYYVQLDSISAHVRKLNE